jgi:hypothetical protein
MKKFKLFELIDTRIKYNKKYNLLIFFKTDHIIKERIIRELDRYLLNKYPNYFIDKRNDIIKIYNNKNNINYIYMIKTVNNIDRLIGYSFDDIIYYNPFNKEIDEREQMLLNIYKITNRSRRNIINLKYIFKNY